MKKVIVLLALLNSSVALNAVTITFTARGNSRPVDAAGNFLADNSLVRLGTFTNGFDFVTNGLNLTALNAAFTQYGTDLTETEPATVARVGSINGVTTTNAIAGKQLYFWIFNTNTAETATQWGIFTNPDASWLAAGDEPPTDTTSISLGLTGIQAKVGTTNTISGTTSGKLAMAIPEPSTYALMGLGLVVVGFLARRRK